MGCLSSCTAPCIPFCVQPPVERPVHYTASFPAPSLLSCAAYHYVIRLAFSVLSSVQCTPVLPLASCIAFCVLSTVRHDASSPTPSRAPNNLSCRPASLRPASIGLSSSHRLIYCLAITRVTVKVFTVEINEVHMNTI